MKNKKNIAVTLAFIGFAMTAPAMAGSVEVGGGTKTYSQEFEVVEHIGESVNKAVVSGSASRTLYQTGEVTNNSFGSTVIDSANPSAIDKAIADYTASGRDYIIAGRAAYNAAHGADKMAGVSIKGTSVSSQSSTEKVFDYETFTRTETKSEDLIFVGDPDSLPSAYVAQGSYDRKDVNDRYYHYETTTVYQVNTSGTISPIILDLDGDGKIQASNGRYLPHEGDFSRQAVMFDFYGNGFPVACEWVGSNDGLLCRPNEDGSVYGTNLFGTANGYSNGYDELASLDGNGDGRLEGAELDGLMVWRDANCNGIADAGELTSLADLGITSIGTSHNNMVGSFVRQGKAYKSFDWWPSIVDCRKVNVALK
ncbi:hypothetical protein IJT17_05810 [bacterium]|nr:hypothetical protein [bacterium]